MFATALPSASTTEKCVVEPVPAPACASSVGVARPGVIVLRSESARAPDSSHCSGTLTKPGSPIAALRRMKPRRSVSISICRSAALPNAGSLGQVAKTLNTTPIVSPADEGGGAAKIV